MDQTVLPYSTQSRQRWTRSGSDGTEMSPNLQQAKTQRNLVYCMCMGWSYEWTLLKGEISLSSLTQWCDISKTEWWWRTRETQSLILCTKMTLNFSKMFCHWVGTMIKTLQCPCRLFDRRKEEIHLSEETKRYTYIAEHSVGVSSCSPFIALNFMFRVRIRNTVLIPEGELQHLQLILWELRYNTIGRF